MPSKTATVRARLEPDLKEETELIFEQLGLSTTEAIRIFFKQVQLQQGLPFDLKIPNDTTKKAIAEAQTRTQVKSVDSTQKLFEDLDI